MNTSATSTGRACATASCCQKNRGGCCSGVHREDSQPAGGLDASQLQPDSWIAQRPWIWFWVGFFVLISVWTGFISFAIKHQPASVPVVSSHG